MDSWLGILEHIRTCWLPPACSEHIRVTVTWHVEASQLNALHHTPADAKNADYWIFIVCSCWTFLASSRSLYMRLCFDLHSRCASFKLYHFSGFASSPCSLCFNSLGCPGFFPFSTFCHGFGLCVAFFWLLLLTFRSIDFDFSWLLPFCRTLVMIHLLL